MDPDVTLVNAREALAAFRSAVEGDSNDAEFEAGFALSEAFEALDEWLSGGGFLPEAWKSL